MKELGFDILEVNGGTVAAMDSIKRRRLRELAPLTEELGVTLNVEVINRCQARRTGRSGFRGLEGDDFESGS